jgi:NAD(P)-dependent dehydrogenase (short-subunit alcohol dehydrogenase family)
VNVSSSDGLYVSWIYSAPYCAIKFAVVGLTEELLYEAAFHGIGVTCFCPGAVKTPIFDTSPVKSFRGELRRLQVKMLRFADSPEDVGRWIVEAVKKDRFLVLTTMEYKLYYFLRKYLPFIWFPYMRLQARLFARMLRKYRE